MRRVTIISLSLVACLSFSCEEPPPPPFMGSESGVPFRKRLAEAERELVQLARAGAKQECFKSDLSGDAGVDGGYPDPGLEAVVRQNEIRGRCIEFVEELENREGENYFLKFANVPFGFPERSNKISHPLSRILIDRKDRMEFEDRCAPLLSSLRRAVDKGISCNPCGFGKEPCTKFMEVLRLRGAFSHMARTGLLSEYNEVADIRERLGICSDVIAFGGALSDRAKAINSNVAMSVAEDASAVAERLLNSDEDIPEGVLDSFIDELEKTIRNWPSLASTVEAWPAWEVFGAFAWNEELSCWVVPEGSDFEPQLVGLNRCVKEADLSLFVAIHMAEKRFADAACDADDSDLVCLKGVDRVCSIYEAYKKELDSKEHIGLEIAREIFLGESQSSDVDVLETVAERMTYTGGLIGIEKIPRTRVLLAALRLLARYRLEYELTGQCPGEDFFEREDLKEFTKDPTCDADMEVERLAPGRFVIRSGAQFGRKQNPEDRVAIFIHCPFFGLGE